LLGSVGKSGNNDNDALVLSVAFLLYHPKLNFADGEHDYYGRMKRQIPDQELIDI
jgi:hypothetical protein